MVSVANGEVVVPGDVVDQLKNVKLVGPGLRVCDGHVVALRCGVVTRDEGNVWINYFEKRYEPVLDDLVVGQVVQQLSDGWKVHIGCAMLANLSFMAFEGATKRNRPDLKLGDVIYAKVVETVEPQLVCVTPDGKAKGMGVLPPGGMVVRYSPGVSRKLLSPNSVILSTIGEDLPFEIACGLNGWIYVKSRTVEDTQAVLKMLQLVECFPTSGCSVSEVFKTLRGF
ncbi:unnamed protein product [Soboliphyme baturini]|uniref:Ribosomal RNA-processing protein 40 n=1 Tax=Soboliphyme baturini TaxID=241478 RepID=A0A183IDM0_9BILA|nr:unnamed protein product [Soboliphyme baturini]